MKKSNVILLALFASAFTAQAEFVSMSEATQAAKAWLSPTAPVTPRQLFFAAPGAAEPTGTQLSTTNGTPFYAIRFPSRGTVFMSSDTDVEPVIAFSKDGAVSVEKGSPLWALLNRDLSGRPKKANAVAQARWARLMGGSLAATTKEAPDVLAIIDDVRVAPFVETRWNQSGAYASSNLVDEVRCFDAAVPAPLVRYEDMTATGVVLRAEEPTPVPCGCGATAMAQMLRYWSYPAGIAAYANDCQLPEDGARFVYGLDGDLEEIHYSMKTEKLSTTAGEYDWETMMLRPLQFSLSTGWTGEPATPEACEAIGKLMYDCGVAVKMSYNFSENGGSGSYARDMDDAFKKYFGYASAAYYGGSAALTEDPETRAHAILSNLDARCPVLLAITGEMGGHAVVADGYGFSGEEKTTYVHLNMGWGGQNDVWYNLPQINVSSNPENFSGFDTLQELIYNLFPTNNGEVVSGRVTDWQEKAVAGAEVLLSCDGVEVARTVTSETGIYSFIVAPGKAYQVRALVAAEDLVGESLTPVIKASSSQVVGSRWGNDVTVAPAAVRFGGEIYALLDSALQAARIASTNDATGVQTVEIAGQTALQDDFVVNFPCAIVGSADQAFSIPVLRPDGACLVVATNGSLAATHGLPAVAQLNVSNVAFAAAGKTMIDVRDSGALALAGDLALESIKTPGRDHLTLLAPIAAKDAIYVTAAGAAAAGEAFATYEGTAAEMAASAAKFVNAANDRLSGVTKDGGAVVWEMVPCDPAIAQVEVVAGNVTSHYLRLDYAFEAVAAETAPLTVTLLRATMPLTRALALPADLTLTSAAGCTVTAAGTAGFTVGAGRNLTLKNVTVKGYTGPAFITVDGAGAQVVLGKKAVLSGFQGTSYGSPAITVLNGTATVLGGAKIEKCVARQYGGAVYLGGAAARLALRGGSLTGCRAAQYGGAVYAYNGSAVEVGGALTVRGNSSNNFAADDIFLQKGATLTLATALTGGKKKCVGVRYSASSAETVALNALGGAFAAVAGGLSAADAAASSAYFLNDTDATVEATPQGSSLVWAALPDDDGQVAPEQASVLAIDESLGLTNYYDSVEMAFSKLSGNAVTVQVLRDMTFAGDLTVFGSVTLTGGAVARSLARAEAVSVLVGPGAALTVSNLVLSSQVEGDALIDVEGGALTLAAGAELRDTKGAASRAASAVVVWDGGVVTMLPGAAIRAAVNGFAVQNLADSGMGGALHLSNATAYLSGGVIEHCAADRAGAVAAGNGARVYVSGDFRVVGNTKLDGATPDNMMVQKSAALVLSAPLSGEAEIGLTPGVQGDAQLIGTIPAWRTWNETTLTNSAVRFVNDLTGERGVVVTNRLSETALLVWRSELAEGVYTTVGADGETVVYGQVGDGSEVPPALEEPEYAVPEEISFSSLAREADGTWRLTLEKGVAWCTYTLYGAPALPPEWSVVTNITLKAEDLTAEGAFTILVGGETTNRFWKAVAAPGVIGK